MEDEDSIGSISKEDSVHDYMVDLQPGYNRPNIMNLAEEVHHSDSMDMEEEEDKHEEEVEVVKVVSHNVA